jgi:glutathione S-transferase
VHQLQLTIADLVDEIHDTHHPLGTSLYYEDQRPRRSARARVLACARTQISRLLRAADRASGGPYLNGRRVCYADLSLFQIIEGLRYAFPNHMKRFERKVPNLIALHDKVAARPNIKAYLASERRIPFNEDGIFRHYPVLDR